MKTRFFSLMSFPLVLLLAGCGSVNVDDYLPDKTVEYKREKQAEKNLEVPPDLTSDRINNDTGIPGSSGGLSTSYSEYVSSRQQAGTPSKFYNDAVLPKIKDIEVVRDGQERWLVVKAPPESVWPKVIDFWQDKGILLLEQDPTVGIMRTSWLENRVTVGRDFITDFMRKSFDSFYDPGTRDQYRVRLERGDNENTTEIFITHFGMEEKLSTTTGGDSENAVWVPTGRDRGLEAEMLRMMMVYMGVADERAKTQLAAKASKKQTMTELVKSRSGVKLVIEEGFARAWRLTGLSLDRVGFAVEDRDRSKGVYFVRYNDPAAEEKEKGGWMSRLAFWSDDSDIDKEARYEVKLEPIDNGTQVVVHNERGERDNSTTAVRILTLIEEQIR